MYTYICNIIIFNNQQYYSIYNINNQQYYSIYNIIQ